MIAVIACGSERAPKIAQIVDEFGFKSKLMPMDAIEDLDGVEAVIISGSPSLLTEQDQSNCIKRFEWIATLPVPILGICFGHQVVGLVYGAECSRIEEVRYPILIRKLKDDAIFDGITNWEFNEDHTEDISIPEHFVKLADSTTCTNEAMRHESKPIFGVQFHPETSGEQGVRLIENFLKQK
jgi:GMP synthase (glutamine-hydrolysing)